MLLSMSQDDGRFFKGPLRWIHTDPTRSNQYCPYCGVFVGVGSDVPSDKEHLVGRNFVPKGSLEDGAFNFIFRSCKECNNQKAEAERHVSSVTLYNSPGRAEDARVDAIARHKAARDIHPDKKVPVQEASEKRHIEFNIGAFSARFGLISPPRLREEDVLALACFHVKALFSLVTTLDCRQQEKFRILPASQVCCLGYYSHGDWGNPQLATVTQRVQSWPCYANVATAAGYFRAVLRRGEKWWFWALEWNRSVRVVGSISNEDELPGVFKDLPPLKWIGLPDGSGRIREEAPLGNVADVLFVSELPDDYVPIPRIV